ncbi:MAG: hypothetical protein JWQ04_1903 [Pedosphaera sp.]|nr:hypothetical protein [Pedosphaera sp.]
MALTKGNDMHDKKLRIGQPIRKPANEIPCESWEVDKQIPVEINHAPPSPRRPIRPGIYYLHLCTTETGKEDRSQRYYQTINLIKEILC